MSTTPRTVKPNGPPLAPEGRVGTKIPWTTTALPDATSVVAVPIRKIVPSRTNPRATLDVEYLTGLAITIEQSGVIQPTLLRPWTAKAEDIQHAIDRATAAGVVKYEPDFNVGDEIYQIVVGECRFLASLKAKKETLPATVRSVSNEQAEIIQNIENLQRKDLDVLDQAESFQRLTNKGLSGDEIAQKVGKSPQWVSSMTRLNTLAEFGKECLRQKWISPGHAVLIARIGDVALQEQALRWVFQVFAPATGSVVELFGKAYELSGGKIMPEKGLREWIKDNVVCDLKRVAWDLADKELYPEAGACLDCEHRTGSNPALFKDVFENDEMRCTKPVCFNTKRQRYVQIELDKAKDAERPLTQLTEKLSSDPPREGARMIKQNQWVKSHKGDCKDTVQGILVDGPDAGKTKWVCVNSRCKKHPHDGIVQAAAPQAVSTQQSAKTVADDNRGAGITHRLGSAGDIDSTEPSDREQKQAYARRLAENAVHESVIEQVLASEVKQIKAPDVELLRTIAEFQLETFHNDLHRIVAALGYGSQADPDKIIPGILKTGSIADLTRLIFLMQVPDSLPIDSAEFKAHAKRSKVDVVKLRKDLLAKIENACFYCGCTELTPCEIEGPNGEAQKCFHMKSGDGVRLHGTACDARPCLEAAMEETKNGAQPQTPVNAKPPTAKDAKDRKEKLSKSSTGNSAGAISATKAKAKSQAPKAKSPAKPKKKAKR